MTNSENIVLTWRKESPTIKKMNEENKSVISVTFLADIERFWGSSWRGTRPRRLISSLSSKYVDVVTRQYCKQTQINGSGKIEKKLQNMCKKKKNRIKVLSTCVFSIKKETPERRNWMNLLISQKHSSEKYFSRLLTKFRQGKFSLHLSIIPKTL